LPRLAVGGRRRAPAGRGQLRPGAGPVLRPPGRGGDRREDLGVTRPAESGELRARRRRPGAARAVPGRAGLGVSRLPDDTPERLNGSSRRVGRVFEAHRSVTPRWASRTRPTLQLLDVPGWGYHAFALASRGS